MLGWSNFDNGLFLFFVVLFFLVGEDPIIT